MASVIGLSISPGVTYTTASVIGSGQATNNITGLVTSLAGNLSSGSGSDLSTYSSSVRTSTSETLSNSSSITASEQLCQPQFNSPVSSVALQTGSGLAFASSCATALWSWSSSSEAFSSACATSTSRILTYTESYPYVSLLPQTILASGTTTLCDGFPRLIGAPVRVTRVFSYATITDTITKQTLPTGLSFATPMPCSINTGDCKALWSSFYAATTNELGYPPCQTNTAMASFDYDICTWGVVSAAEAQLIYWPATAASQSKYFCAAPSSNGPISPGEEGGNATSIYKNETITYFSYPVPAVTPFFPSPTGDGPNTAIVGTATITSPSVAIHWKGVGRWDGCGPTIDTIAMYDPSDITTVRGYGGGPNLAYMPINYADLNWMCPHAANNGTYTTAIGPDGNKCYQDVAAHAYWQARDKVGTWLTANRAETVDKATLTISPDYHIYVSQTPMPREVFESYFGGGKWLFNGMWGEFCFAKMLTADSQDAKLTCKGAQILRSFSPPQQMPPAQLCLVL